MSVEVMYQPYSSYFPYQRAPVSHATDTLKKFGASRMQDSLESLAYGNSVLTSSLALGGGVVGGGLGTASGSASSTAASPVASSSTVKSEEDSSDKDNDQALSTQYLSANCVLVTYFSGDIASNVDDHFTRALSQPSSFNAENQGSKPGQPWKDVSPMSQRNFPASFWNSSYQGSLSSGPHHDLSSLHSADPYMASSLHTMSQLHHNDPWRTYSGLSSATQPHTYTPHASMHDLAYSSMSASRFNAHYGSLLPSAAAASRLHGGMGGQCDLTAVKHSAADSWSSRYATDALTSHVHDAHAVHSAATSIPGGKWY